MKLTKYGWKEWLSASVITAAAITGAVFLALYVNLTAGITLGILAALFWVTVAGFFRVPYRNIPKNSELILSPADGIVRDIELINDDSLSFFEGQNIVRIGIFLSVLDVHINRAPADVNIEYKKYQEGKFLDARNRDALKENESMIIGGTAKAGNLTFPLAVKQISGAIARRIVCPVKISSSLRKGEIYGMIKFGSRTELYLPADKNIEVNIKVGERVFAGVTAMAKVKTNQDK